MNSDEELKAQRNVCHWSCCQRPRDTGFSLCKEHVELSRRLHLKVWPLEETEDEVP